MGAETATREKAQLCLEQGLNELRSGLLETKAGVDRRERETSQRFKAASEALALGDGQRKSSEIVLEAVLAEVQRLHTLRRRSAPWARR